MTNDYYGVQPQLRQSELVEVERNTLNTMDEQLRLLADAVERIQAEPFTVRKLVILSPYARERSASGQALAGQSTYARPDASERVMTRRAFGLGEDPPVQGSRGARGDS